MTLSYCVYHKKLKERFLSHQQSLIHLVLLYSYLNFRVQNQVCMILTASGLYSYLNLRVQTLNEQTNIFKFLAVQLLKSWEYKNLSAILLMIPI